MAKRAATIANGDEVTTRTVGEAIELPIDALVPNGYNPNVQSDWMFQKELASIQEFGFVDPIIVRDVRSTATPHDRAFAAEAYEIIDGEHRWKAAAYFGYATVPCWNLGIVDDSTARQLTVVLNETRGRSDERKLQDLLADLLKRRPEQELRQVMPFSQERFDELLNRREIDWGSLEEKRNAMRDEAEANTRWKELVFRLPGDAAAVVEDALDALCKKEGLKERWQALEMLAADSLA
jgi:hypothetical protein